MYSNDEIYNSPVLRKEMEETENIIAESNRPKGKCYDGYIFGSPGPGKNLYLVNWYYISNFGTYMAYAESEEDAMRYSQYDKEAVKYQITKVDVGFPPMLFNYGKHKGDFTE